MSKSTTIIKHPACATALLASLSIAAAASPTCVDQIGGGGFADFDCYELNAARVESDNRKLESEILHAPGLSVANKASLRRYMRAQDDSVKGCDMAVDFSFAWGIDIAPKTHRNIYDVISARCRYTIRKQQHDFLHELVSIKND